MMMTDEQGSGRQALEWIREVAEHLGPSRFWPAVDEYDVKARASSRSRPHQHSFNPNYRF
jgi:hypothetical protein